MTAVNPFDLRTVLMAKHAQHVVLIHFPLALFITGVLFDLLSRGKRTSQLANAGGCTGVPAKPNRCTSPAIAS